MPVLEKRLISTRFLSFFAMQYSTSLDGGRSDFDTNPIIGHIISFERFSVMLSVSTPNAKSHSLVKLLSTQERHVKNIFMPCYHHEEVAM